MEWQRLTWKVEALLSLRNARDLLARAMIALSVQPTESQKQCCYSLDPDGNEGLLSPFGKTPVNQVVEGSVLKLLSPENKHHAVDSTGAIGLDSDAPKLNILLDDASPQHKYLRTLIAVMIFKPHTTIRFLCPKPKPSILFRPSTTTHTKSAQAAFYRPYTSKPKSSDMGKSILVVGLSFGPPANAPENSPVPGPDAKLKEAVAASMKAVREAGYDITVVQIDPSNATADIDGVKEKLKAEEFDMCMIGFGLRSIPAYTGIFEDLVNASREIRPGLRLGFNTGPTDMVESLKRGGL
ncbi:hypothetical protein EJ05DRAFT_506967 [Pseudovirgaria hyperparasitica]|uniref:Uncharacterized protein n=1 Tax=Pseudovirgaria hyperparasitica TaxID=470096 RepID=A0A6A6WMD5_9PEZI|nr:uncharacterized protein EJ05DRAFT_506967 [Pseudovirgaria hyperparasitica]KAF2763364.1 hypothetical protein EJ05DRAFT_506967 [Pseudovirgaria hyperparasitica]